jgi:hypothetical protein
MNDFTSKQTLIVWLCIASQMAIPFDPCFRPVNSQIKPLIVIILRNYNVLEKKRMLIKMHVKNDFYIVPLTV